MPAKKNSLSRFLLNDVPGMMIGPPTLPPGYWNELSGFLTPAIEFDRSLAANLWFLE